MSAAAPHRRCHRHRRRRATTLALWLAVWLWISLSVVGSAQAAQINHDAQFMLLPAMTPLEDAGFDRDIGRWQIGLRQQRDHLSPTHGNPGFDVNLSALEVGVLRSLGFAAGADRPNSIWNRLAIDGRALAGPIYGRDHTGDTRLDGAFGAISGRFGLQILRRTAAVPDRTHTLCGVFGAGVTYALLSLTGPGPNAEIGTSLTHIDVGLQASLALTPTWTVQPFVIGHAGWHSLGVVQNDRLTTRDRLVYRVDGGAEFTWQWNDRLPDNRLGLEAAVTWTDTARLGFATAVRLHRGF